MSVYSKKMKTWIQKCICTSMFIAALLRWRATCVSIHGWMGKEDVLCISNGLWLRHEKEWNLAICDNMDEPWECYTKWNKSEEKDKYHTNTIWSCMLGSCISHVRLFVTFELFMGLIVHGIIIHGIMNNNPMAPLLMEFPRQEPWSGLSFPSPAIRFYSYVLVEPKTKPNETNE